MCARAEARKETGGPSSAEPQPRCPRLCPACPRPHTLVPWSVKKRLSPTRSAVRTEHGRGHHRVSVPRLPWDGRARVWGWPQRALGCVPGAPLPVTHCSPCSQALRLERTDPGQLSLHCCPEPLRVPSVGTPRAGPKSHPERHGHPKPRFSRVPGPVTSVREN